jgi:hypothetical protein
MTEFPPVPYITASMLNRYRGRTVRMLGRVTQASPDGSRYSLETPDGAVLSVTRANPRTDGMRAGWACVTGVVHPDQLCLQENLVDWLEGAVDGALAKSVIEHMQKLPALFAV